MINWLLFFLLTNTSQKIQYKINQHSPLKLIFGCFCFKYLNFKRLGRKIPQKIPLNKEWPFIEELNLRRVFPPVHTLIHKFEGLIEKNRNSKRFPTQKALFRVPIAKNLSFSVKFHMKYWLFLRFEHL